MIRDTAQQIWRVIRQPALVVPFFTWAALSGVVHLATPVEPICRVEMLTETNEFGTFLPQVAATSNDGRIVATVQKESPLLTAPPWGSNIGLRGPIRVWDLGTGKRINEFPETQGYVPPFRLSSDGAWLIFDEPHVVYHVATGKKTELKEFIFSEMCQSHNGRWVACWQYDSLWYYDLEAEELSGYHQPVPRIDEHGAARSFHGFSEDDRYLILRTDDRKGGRTLWWLDFEEGVIVKQAAIAQHWQDDLKIARDATMFVAWERNPQADARCSFHVDRGKRHINLWHATWLGWDRTQEHFLLCRRGSVHGEFARLERWHILSQQHVAEMQLPAPVRVGKPFWLPAQLAPALSPDATRIAWAEYKQAEPLSPWMAKVRSWVGLPPPSNYYDVRILDATTFREIERWPIDTEYHDWGYSATLQWKGDRLFFYDGKHAQLWNAPPKTWSQSMGIALALVVLLAAAYRAVRAISSSRQSSSPARPSTSSAAP